MYYICVFFQLCTKARCYFLSSGPRAANILKRGGKKKQQQQQTGVSVTNSSHFFSYFLDSRLREAYELCAPLFFRHKYTQMQVNELLLLCCVVLRCMCTFQESLGLHLWQRDRDLSQGLNKQLWHSGGTLGAAPHLSRAAGGWRAGGVGCGWGGCITCLYLMAWSVTFLQTLTAAEAAALLGIH